MSGPRGWQTLAAGVRPYLDSFLVAVVLAPVLPDVAVDVLGGGLLPDAVLRFLALAVVFAFCGAAFWFRRWRAQRRARRTGYQLSGIEPRDVLVLPISFPTRYQNRANRTGPPPLANWLIDTIEPRLVIGVASPDIPAAQLDDLRTQLGVDNITFDHLTLPDVLDADVAVRYAESQLLARCGQPELANWTRYVDITGGNVVMSIAMLRAAAALSADCVYVSARRENNQVVEGSQQGHSFDPRRLLATPPTVGEAGG